MRRARVEVIAGTIEIDGQKEDRVVPVLIAIRLRLHEQHLLREPVWRVGFLRISIPEVIFLEGHRRELRICADGADANELRDPRLPRLVKELRPHHQVVVEKLAGPLAVRADAADNRGKVNDQRGLCVPVDPDDVGVFAKVVLTARREMTAEETAAAGDEYPLLTPETHR